MTRYFFILALLLLAGLSALYFLAMQKPPSSTLARDDARIHAPDFPAGLEWLNTDKPISLKQLRGKVVLLDFWTYCCINCLHVIPDLKKLEKKYPHELVVIGVHSAKFANEKETENIRQAILRYEIEHPVINDADFRVWDEYAVRAWPTFYLIDPEGYIVARTSGEGIYEPFDRVIGELVSEFDRKKLLNRAPLQLALEKSRAPSSLLAFPGKILADEKSSRLFISDSNHNRILVSDLNGQLQAAIGGTEAGFEDGTFEQARFKHPLGLALQDDILYVADTENHAIRKVDLKAKKVTTLAGTGQQGRDGKALNSPWDIFLQNKTLYIAMAGSHQLWKFDLNSAELSPFAGSGIENIHDGPGPEAALAQPSGLTGDGQKLYFADSEVSAVRSAELKTGGVVETIVGRGLFDFGDRDGTGDEARLQHPLGVTHHDGKIYVADSYNHKIKVIDPTSRSSKTFLGDGKTGIQDGVQARFHEPSGLSIAAGKLYIADTNNHSIRVADLKTREVSTLSLSGMENILPTTTEKKFRGETRTLSKISLGTGLNSLRIDLQLPSGFEINASAPTHLELQSSKGNTKFANGQSRMELSKPKFPLELPVELAAGDDVVQADLTLYYCEASKKSLCLFKSVRLEQPVATGSEQLAQSLELKYQIQ